MKKATSFLLALVMLFSMLPGAAMTVSAAEETQTLQGYYTRVDMVIDGSLSEVPWMVDDSDVVLLSNQDYLFVGMKTTESTLKFTINGVTLTADYAAGDMLLNGDKVGIVAKNAELGTVEVRIPLSVLGLSYAPAQTVDFAYNTNTIRYTGTAVLASRAVLRVENFEDVASRPFGKNLGASENEGYIEQGEGSLDIKTGPLSSGGYELEFLSQTLAEDEAEFDKGFELAFTADFNDLTIPAATSGSGKVNWPLTGFNIDLRLAAESDKTVPYSANFYYGFHADASGKIYITQREYSYLSVKRIDTGLTLPATNVDVRLVADDTGKTTVYINGTALSTTFSKPTWPMPSSGGRGFYILSSSTKYRGNDTDVNDVRLHDMMLTQAAPAAVAEDETHVVAPVTGAVPATAYLKAGDLALDGMLTDVQWYLPYAAQGATGAPGAAAGFMWDGSNLYVGAETLATGASLTLGGTTVTADLSAMTATAGKVVVSQYGFEWRIPFANLGVTPDFGQELAYELELTGAGGTSDLGGMLTLAGTKVLVGDAVVGATDKNYTKLVSTRYISWEQEDDGYHVKTTDAVTETTRTYHWQYAEIDYAGGFELETDLTLNDLPNVGTNFGIRGLGFELWDATNRSIFALRQDGNGNVMMDMRNLYFQETVDTGVNLGERATFKIVSDARRVPCLYVNGEFVHAFAFAERTDGTPYPRPRFDMLVNTYDRIANADGTTSGVDVVMHEMLLTQAAYETAADVVDAAMDELVLYDEAATDANEIITGGSVESTTKVNLFTSGILLEGAGVYVPAAVTVIDRATGAKPTNMNSAGRLSAPSAPQIIEVTVTATYGGVSKSKTFEVHRGITDALTSSVGLIVDDANPATGQVTDWTYTDAAYLDTTHNSIVVDQGASKAFNRIVLHDSDEYSRVSARHLGVFTSEDGANWTKVTGWLMHQSGKDYTLYNLNATARYVKVHSYHDDLDVTSAKTSPSFSNLPDQMITVSNETYLPGAAGEFQHSAEYIVTNSTDKAQKDAAVQIKVADLKATADQYKTDLSDFRFTIDNTVLAHWYNGEDSFYVRVPAVEAQGNVTIKAQWGCESAEDFSDAETVFEVTYGNVALIDLSLETYDPDAGARGHGEGLGTHGRPFTFPNGDVIVVGRQVDSDADIAVFRSTDGGHTFDPTPVIAYDDSNYVGRGSGFGGFLWDPSIGSKGRLYLLGYNGKVGDASDYRLLLIYSDDYGYNWSEPTFLNLPGSELIKKKVNGVESDAAYIELQNAEVRVKDGAIAKRAITYCDGLKLKNADGTGSNVDYVIIQNDTWYANPENKPVTEVTEANGALSNVATAIYSTDGGKTWTCSDTLLEMPGVDPTRNAEDGLSETGFAQLDDGSLFLVMRAQQEGNYYYYEAHSYDDGKIWTADYGDILGSNTSPVLSVYGKDRLMTWATRTGLGQVSYRRTPMFIGVSSDNYETFDKVLDVTFGTSFDTLRGDESRMTQFGVAFSPDGKDAFVSYYDHYRIFHVWSREMAEYVGTTGFLIEDFDQMLYGTKGGYDNFESTSLKFQGWLADVDGNIELTDEQAASGKYAMKVVDDNAGASTHAVRQVPSMKAGTVGAKLMVPSTNKDPFVMELKAAYNFTYMQFTLAAIAVAPDGTVSLCNDDGSLTKVTTVAADSWNEYALSFDIATKKGSLSVNGKVVADNIALMTDEATNPIKSDGTTVSLAGEGVVKEITSVQFGQMEGTLDNGDCLYVDDFYATEPTVLTGKLVAEEPEEPDVPDVPTLEQPLLGDFVRRVVKTVTIDGQEWEFCVWRWSYKGV